MLQLRLKLPSLVVASAALLVACGGGGSSGPADAFGAQLSAALASGQVGTGSLGAPAQRTAASGIVKPTITDDQLFDWAEVRYGDLFPKGPKTVSLEADGVSYRVRHYPTTGNYLGVAASGMVYGLGPATQGVLLQLGSLDSYVCQVVPDSCAAPLE